MRDQRQLPEDRHSMRRVHSGSMFRGNARRQKLALRFGESGAEPRGRCTAFKDLGG